MKWFIPSWNGDIRVEPKGEGSLLRVFSPTPREKEALTSLGKQCVEQGWVKKWKVRWGKDTSVDINAPFEKIGGIITELLRPGPAVTTAIAFKDGHVETHTGPKVEEKVAAAAESGEAKAAATVKRPTPCCPRCIPGAVQPASEVLLSFLSPEEHAFWAEHRALIVYGGLSGHQYLLSHRHAHWARRVGRICFDLTSRVVVHFHDWTVPPEEEVLAAKLILEHHEPWLRNEATLHHLSFGRHAKHSIFKNPFGGFDDGVFDAGMISNIGQMLGVPATVERISIPPELAG